MTGGPAAAAPPVAAPAAPPVAAPAAPPEIRFALAMNGGVSLAVWIGGVCDELLRLCAAVDERPGRRQVLGATEPGADWSVYELVCWAADARARVDVMSGASAGGMNAVFLALGLVHRQPDLTALRNLWLDAGSFASLLRDPLDADAPSLMRGDDYFLTRLQEALRELAQGAPDTTVPLDITLTATSMEGIEQSYAQRYGDPIREKDHRVTFRFHQRAGSSDLVAPDGDTDPHARERVIHRLARACRTTASFPGAFEPSRGIVSTDPSAPLDAFLPAQTNLTGPSWLIDGGTLVNLPVEEALTSVFEMPATGAVRRIFAMIVPDPSTAPPAGGTSAVDAPPSLATVITSALSTIPRNQMVGSFLRELQERNDRLQVARGARLRLVALDRQSLQAAAAALFHPYRTSRTLTSDQLLAEHLDARLLELVPAAQRAEVRAAWTAELAKQPAPWIPTALDALDVDSLRRWGRTTVRRSAARLLHLASTAADAGVPLADVARWRGTATTVIASMPAPTRLTDRKTNLFSSVAAFVPAAGGDLATHAATAVAALRAHWGEGRASVALDLRTLAGVADQLRQALVDAGVTSLPALTGAPSGVDTGLQLLLALEVVENSFGGFANEIEQPVESLRIDSLGASPLDPLHRGEAAGKVAGVQLAHFGSFLKASWRANDWMWGRLDGSADLVRLMLREATPRSLDRLRAHLGLTTGVGERLDDALVDALVRRRHADIVLEETATVVAGIARDRDAGGHTSAAAGGLERAWQAELRRWPPAPEEREQRARALLTLNRIGSEALADEAGSDLLTRTAVTALATGSTVLHRSSPKLLSGVVSTVRYVALLLWGFGKGSMGGPYTRTLGGLLFGIGGTIVVVELLPGVSTGPVLPFGVLALVAGTLLGFLRAPFVVVPTLFFAAVPLLLREMPASEDRWGWWPSGWLFPTLHGRLPWLPPVAALAGIVVIGLLRRPVWFRGITVDHRTFDERLVAIARPAPVPAPTSDTTAPAPARRWPWHLALWGLALLAPAAKTAQVIATHSLCWEVLCAAAVVVVVLGVAWFVVAAPPASQDASADDETKDRRRWRLRALGLLPFPIDPDPLAAPGAADGATTARLVRRIAALVVVPAALVAGLPDLDPVARWLLVGVVGALVVTLLVAQRLAGRAATPPMPGSLGRASSPWWVVPLAAGGAGTAIALGAGAGAGDLTVRRVIELVVLTVLGEELIFRGGLFAIAHRVLRPQLAAFVTAASFALWHVGDAWNAAHADSGSQRVVRLTAIVLMWLVAGLALGFLRRRSRTLLGPILGHLGARLPAFVLSSF